MPILVASSTEGVPSTSTRHSATAVPRDRYISRNARQLSCPNAWPSARSARARRS
jgi:hypothetical protein